jgi:predicted nucleic acid-binding protein
VKGIGVHDARLVASMMVHGVNNLLTFDTGDFKRYEEITPVCSRAKGRAQSP